MPGRPCCPVQPPTNTFLNLFLLRKLKPKELSPAVAIALSHTTSTTSRPIPKTIFKSSLYARALLQPRRRVFDNVAPAFIHTTSKTESVLPTASRACAFSTAHEVTPNFNNSFNKLYSGRNLTTKSRQIQERSSIFSKVSIRQLSTKPSKPRSQQQQQQRTPGLAGLGTSFADLDDSTDPAAALQKSLAAVPHYAAKNEMKLRCTELDAKGNIIRSTTGEFLKSDMCQQLGLHPRDLRKIDGGFSNQMPVVLVRPELILVNLGHIRALIKADLVMLFDSPDSKDRVEDSPFVKDLQEKLKLSTVEARGQPYEFRALEAIFLSVVASLHAEMEVLVHFVTKLLAHVEDNIDQQKLKEMLQYTKKVSRFESRTLLTRDVFEELLDQDEDLAAMYLTEKKEGHPRVIDKHDEAEILLEAYMKQVEEIANVVSMVKHQMHSTEDFVNVILGAKRNQLLLFELRIAMGTLGISSGAIIASLYGMNLQNYLEQDPHAFAIVSATAVAISASVFAACLRKLNVLAKGTT